MEHFPLKKEIMGCQLQMITIINNQDPKQMLKLYLACIHNRIAAGAKEGVGICIFFQLLKEDTCTPEQERIICMGGCV